MKITNLLSALWLLIGLHSQMLAQVPELTQVAMQFKENPVSINGLAQDSRGYVWIADGANGLFRYDGIHLVQYKNSISNPNSLPSDRLECITASPDGSIWIGTFQYGLVHFDPVKEIFARYQHDSTNPKSIRSDNIRAMTIDSAGGLWIGTRNGVDYYDAAKNQFRHQFTSDPDERILQNEHVRSMYTDRHGIVWIGCGSPFITEETTGGLFKLDISKKTVDRYIHTSDKNSLIDNRVRAIFEDSKGNFWIGTAGDGLHTMDRASGTFERHEFDAAHPERLSRPAIGHLYDYADDQIVSILEDGKGFVWIATFQGGINRYDPTTKKIQHFGRNEPGIYHLPRNDYWCALKTHDGLLWFAGWQNYASNDQLLKINPDPKKMENVSLNAPINSFAEDKEKNIYMASGNTVIRLNRAGEYDTILHFDKDGPINDLRIDADANLWIASGAGLMKYNLASKNFQVYRAEQHTGLENNVIFRTCILNTDSILVVANPGLLYLLDLKQNRFTKYEYKNADSTIHMPIISMLVDTHKNIWIGTSVVGLLRLDINNKKLLLYKLRDVPQESVFDICEDPASGVYIGTWRSGFRKYNPANDMFETITDVSGLVTQETTVSSIHKGSDGILWLETQSGIVKYDLQKRTSSHFGRSWGYFSNSITNNGFFVSSDDTYYKGTVSGFLRFRPVDLESRNQNRANIFINKLLVNNQLISMEKGHDQELRLSYNQNNLAVELGFVNFLSDPSDQFIQYMLKGYDDTWRNGESGQQVSYLKLPPGSYLFRLKGLDFYGNWNEISLAVQISPPWYKTWWAYTIYGLLLVALVFAFHRYMKARVINAEREKNRARELAQAKEIEKAYHELRTTQSQMIEQEKMASLGELTAGIAHEIQNPLNFVNNFSEVNRELIDELEAERSKAKGERNEQLESNIIHDIKANEEKIIHHGKRADAIVKSMLQHSRTSSAHKEPTDINALADEYLRLAYHGLRAKDKNFNSKFETDFDPLVGKINIIPQDIGRVLLNLINNAFYAVNEKSKQEIPGYEPAVTVMTRKVSNAIVISVVDNGNGIPTNIRDKIFHPFFTTKQTGQGTGLGLSLAYDIVKAHGGELKVETREGEGTEFIVQLPGG